MAKYIEPVITVGVTTYNRPDMLMEAVHSILNQTFVYFKIIIGNDYQDSLVTFDTLGIESDSRIEIVNFKKNQGEIGNMNFLLGACDTKWFTWLSDDDIMHPKFLEECFNVIERNNVVAVYSDYMYFNNDTSKISFGQINNVPSTLYSSKRFIFSLLNQKIRILGCYGVIKTEVLKRAGGMPTLGNSFSPYSDDLVSILVAEFGNSAVLNFPLIFMRTHADSISFTSVDFYAYTTAEKDFLLKLEGVCKRLRIDSEEFKYLKILQFIKNEEAVLMRSEISRVSSVKIFFTHQFKEIFPKLSIEYWPIYTYNLLKLILINNMLFLLKKIKK